MQIAAGIKPNIREISCIKPKIHVLPCEFMSELARVEDIFPPERRQRLLDWLRRDGKIVAAEVAHRLNVSIDTIRRDLNQLALEGFIQRVHGGALPLSPGLRGGETGVGEQKPGKMQIAEKAAQLVQNGSVVFFDCGNTVLEIAKQVPPRLRFTAITHHLPAALALAERTDSEIILLGGRVNRTWYYAFSPNTAQEIRRFRVDLLFMSICSIDAEAGISCHELEDLELRKAMIESSSVVAGVATKEKLGTAAPFVLGPASLLDYLITEDPESFGVEFRRFGVTVL